MMAALLRRLWCGAMFSVDYDPDRGIVRLMIEGFWDAATVEAFAAETLVALRRARAETGRSLVLTDARSFQVQSLDVATAFDLAELRIGPARERMAIVVSSALSKMQGQRALAGTDTMFFTDVAAAERWLLAPASLARSA